MILPTKHIPANETLIGAGVVILQRIQSPIALSTLWESTKNNPAIQTYERFISTLDMLHIIGAIHLENNKIKRA
ncbi:MAG TPA: hypothetical protein DD412_08830 [Holosporales bacterium]|nr:hypothetical protein [Holosporales bacterium]